MIREAQLDLSAYLLRELDEAQLNGLYVGDRLKRFFQGPAKCGWWADYKLIKQGYRTTNRCISKQLTAPGVIIRYVVAAGIDMWHGGYV